MSDIPERSISVIVTAMNEEGNLRPTIDAVVKAVAPRFLKYEIIILDDGSTDQTPHIANGLASRNQYIRVHLIRHGFYSHKKDRRRRLLEHHRGLRYWLQLGTKRSSGKRLLFASMAGLHRLHSRHSGRPREEGSGCISILQPQNTPDRRPGS